jgi:HupE / UreJ protein
VLTSDSSTIALDRSDASWWTGMQATMGLGMRHIAEGTDHLMFLAMLLLPAPLLAAGRGLRSRWRERRGLGSTLRRAGLIFSVHRGALAVAGRGVAGLGVVPDDAGGGAGRGVHRGCGSARGAASGAPG